MKTTVQSASIRRASNYGKLFMAMVGCSVIGLIGCEQSSKTVEITTPHGDAAVKKTTTTTVPTGVDIVPTKKTTIEVETTKVPKD